MSLRELIEKTIAKALIMVALTPRGVQRDIPAECAADLLGHLEAGEHWHDEAIERMSRRGLGLPHSALGELLDAALGEQEG